MSRHLNLIRRCVRRRARRGGSADLTDVHRPGSTLGATGHPDTNGDPAAPRNDPRGRHRPRSWKTPRHVNRVSFRQFGSRHFRDPPTDEIRRAPHDHVARIPVARGMGGELRSQEHEGGRVRTRPSCARTPGQSVTLDQRRVLPVRTRVGPGEHGGSHAVADLPSGGRGSEMASVSRPPDERRPSAIIPFGRSGSRRNVTGVRRNPRSLSIHNVGSALALLGELGAGREVGLGGGWRLERACVLYHCPAMSPAHKWGSRAGTAAPIFTE